MTYKFFNIYFCVNYVKKIKDEISKINIGSIAIINQITTISKQRIFDDDILRRVRLSNSCLDLLDTGIKNILKNKGEL